MKIKRFLLTLLIITSVYLARAQDSLVTVVTDAGHMLNNFTVSPDGNFLLTQSKGSIALWNLKTMQTINIVSLPNAASYIPKFGPGDPLIAYIKDSNSASNKNYEGYHMLTGDFMGIKSEDELMPRITSNSKYIFKRGEQAGEITVLYRSTGRLFQTLTSKPMSPLGNIDLTEDDSLLLLTGMHPQIWNLRKAKLERKLPFAEYILAKDTSVFFRNQIIPVKKDMLSGLSRQWCKGCFTADGHIMLGGHDDISTWTYDGKFLKAQETEGWPVLDWMDYGGNRYVATWQGGLQIGRITDNKLKRIGVSMDFISEVMSDGTTYYSSLEGNLLLGTTHPQMLYKTQSIASFVNSNLSANRRNILLAGELGNIIEMSMEEDSKMFKYLSNMLFRRSRVNAARFLQGEEHIVGGCSDGIIALWQHKQPNPIWHTMAHRGQVMDIMPTHRGKQFVTSGSDGWSRIFDWEQCRELMAMYSPEGSNDYLFLTPDNYYKGTKGVFSDIHFAKGTETFSFDQFDLKFNRPDIVLQRLGGDKKEIELMHQAWLKRVKRMGFTPDQLSSEVHVPESNIVNIDEIPYEVSERKITLHFSAVDRKYKLARLMLYLNGVPLFSRHGLDIAAPKQSHYEMYYDLELTTGVNEITFSCINERGAESSRQKLTILCTPTDSHVPDLYIVAIGVSEYAQEGVNLQYAAKDAKDFTHLMSTTLQKRFGHIHTLCLTDDEVTSTNLDCIVSFMQQSRREDVVMLYYAGHGLLDRQADYYLSTHDTNFKEPSQNSIPFEQTEDWFDSIAALNRCYFIDACHSGELDKDDLLAEAKTVVPEGKIIFRNTTSTQLSFGQGIRQVNALLEDLFIDTRWGIGATVISSAGGLESAIEGDEWKNGLFTWCLRKGLNDPKADSNNNGELTMGELTQYLRNEVYRLSEGRQQPTLRSGKSNMTDFIIK